ncbi:FMRFamide receptor [Elysia marginata]|uniref:FMRFamide receptor n=1 Tax=Elysia marginata TaxID=1093978 RepID=A0AAV4FNA9_9GAST|nr:FMRFamide receptor [Elysia marginata]
MESKSKHDVADYGNRARSATVEGRRVEFLQSSRLAKLQTTKPFAGFKRRANISSTKHRVAAGKAVPHEHFQHETPVWKQERLYLTNMVACLNVTLDAVVPVNGTLGDETTAAFICRVIKKIALPSVCAFGVVGNILNLTILTRRKLQKSFRTLEQAANLCLIALALSDLMFCLAVFPSMFLPEDGRHSSETSILAVYNLYHFFVINIFIMESTLLTVAMSLERFMAICFPLRQDLYLTTRRIKYVIAFTVVFSVLFNIPVAFRYEITPHCGFPSPTNFTTIGTTESPVAYADTSDGDHPHRGHSGYSFAGTGDLDWRGIREKNVSVKQPSDSPSPEDMHSLKQKSVYRSFVSPETFLSPVTVPMTLPLSAQQPRHATVTGSNSTRTGAAGNSSLQTVYYTIEEIKIGGSDALDNIYRWAWAVAGNFVPLILLFYFNVCLWWKIYLSYKLRRQFHQAPRSSHILTLTLVAIVVMFFILVAPTETVLALKNTITMERDTANAIEHILNLMQTINFSVNFVLYCIISPYFRKTLKYIVLCGLYNVYQNTSSKEWKKDYETSLM